MIECLLEKEEILWAFEVFPTSIQTKFNSQSGEEIRVPTDFPILMEALNVL